MSVGLCVANEVAFDGEGGRGEGEMKGEDGVLREREREVEREGER